MKKKLVALLTNNDDDIYCFRKELIEALLAHDYEVLISCPYGEKFELMEGIEYLYDNPEIDRRGTNVLADSKLLRHYHRLFKQYQPDVVLTYTAKPNVYGSMAANRLHIPVINNLTGIGSVKNQSKAKKDFILRLFRHAYNKSSCVMFQNETNMRDAIDNGLVKGDYMLIPGSGVNTERYPLQEYPDGGDGIHGDPIIFNYIGRILKDKGIEDYIAAAKRIRKRSRSITRGPNTRCRSSHRWDIPITISSYGISSTMPKKITSWSDRDVVPVRDLWSLTRFRSRISTRSNTALSSSVS